MSNVSRCRQSAVRAVVLAARATPSQCLSSTMQSIISFADQGEELAEPKAVSA